MPHVSIVFFSLPTEYKVRCSARQRCEYHPEMCRVSPALQEEALPSAHSALPSPLSIPHLTAPAWDCGAQARVSRVPSPLPSRIVAR